MNLNLLRLASVMTPVEGSTVRRSFDCPAQGVVIIDVATGIYPSAVPLHWRVGNWTKPPLDVRLSDKGIVESVQLVLQDESVPKILDIAPPSTLMDGLPVFDIQNWSDDRYIDVQIPVEVFQLHSGDLYANIGNAAPERVIATPGLRFYFDPKDKLVGIALGPLLAEDWRLIDSAMK